MWHHASSRFLRIRSASMPARTTLTLRRVATSGGATRFHSDGAGGAAWDGGIRLTSPYSTHTLQAVVVRHCACYPDSPTIEMWTTLPAAAGANRLIVSRLIGWRMSVPAGT